VFAIEVNVVKRSLSFLHVRNTVLQKALVQGKYRIEKITHKIQDVEGQNAQKSVLRLFSFEISRGKT